MNVSDEMKQTIRNALNEAIRDFYDAYRGVIEQINSRGDYGKIEMYPVIEIEKIACTQCSGDCDAKRYEVIREVENYLSEWEERIHDALLKRLNYPFKPIVEIHEDDGEFTLELGYIICSDIDFIYSLEEC